MVRPTDLPVVHPTYEHRPLSAAEVIELAHNRPVAGVNPDNPLVKAIGRLNPGVSMNIVFQEARQHGYLLALSRWVRPPRGYFRLDRPLVLVVCGGWSSRDLHAGRS